MKTDNFGFSIVFALFFSLLLQFPTTSLSQIFLKSPVDGQIVQTHGEEISEFLNLSMPDRRIVFNNMDRRAQIFREREPVPTRFVWTYSDDIEGPFIFEIARDSYFTKPASILIISQKGSENYGEVVATNFLLDSKYYWRVTGKRKGQDFTSNVANFTIANDAPRLISLPNVPNVRDLGGWSGLGGKKIKQGMIFRSEGLNFNSPDQHTKDVDPKMFRPGKSRLTEGGREYIKDQLGWKVELDLRRDDEVGAMKNSPAGSQVEWIHNASQSYKRIFNSEGRKAMAQNFRLFTDINNYPINFHCISGADRTGSLAFILNGVLGVSLDDLAKDWEISAYKTFVYEERWDQLIKGLSEYGDEDTPIYIKIENYLHDIGITQYEIEKFRSIMLEN